MEKSQSMSQPPSQSTQSTQNVRFQDCLLVSRHELLDAQENDLSKVCQKITKVDSLPTDPIQLRKLIDFYDAVVGVMPLPLQLQILQAKRAVLIFEMESIGTTKTREEALDLLMKSGKEGVILPPAREGEPFRISIYKGIKLVKKIVVEDEFIIKH